MPQLFPSGLGVFQKERKEVTLNLLLQVEGELDFYSLRGRVIVEAGKRNHFVRKMERAKGNPSPNQTPHF